ncbi:MAG: aldo/keto reductase [Coprobacillaceae bacterium]
MKYSKIGNSNKKVSRLCLGCMTFGDSTSQFHDWTLPYEESKEIIKHALDSGINFFDTANVYSKGTSEEYLGKALKELNVDRESVFIATKVYFNEGKLSKEAIKREIDLSLERLQMDYIDLYIIHRFDASTPIEETMEALNELVVSGKVKNIGASAMYGYQFHNMQEIAEKNGWAKFVTMQNHYNMLYREDEREMIPVCKQYGTLLTPYSPLASGRLARAQWHTDSKRSQTDKTAVAKYDAFEEADKKIVERVLELSKKYNCTMTQVSLAYLLEKGVTAPIIGASKIKYIDDACGTFNIQLSEEDIEYLEELYVPHNIVGAI